MTQSEPKSPFPKIIGFLVVIAICGWLISNSLKKSKPNIKQQKIALSLEKIAQAFETAEASKNKSSLDQLDGLKSGLDKVETSYFPEYFANSLVAYRNQLDRLVTMMRAPMFKRDELFDNQMIELVKLEDKLKESYMRYIKNIGSEKK